MFVKSFAKGYYYIEKREKGRKVIIMKTIAGKKVIYLLMMGITIGAFLSLGTASYAQEVRSNFSSSVRSGEAPLEVSFANESAGTVLRRLWDFGDGNTSSDADPTHVYERAGNYTVTLTVKGARGIDTEVKRRYITVTESQGPPQADFITNVTSGAPPLYVGFADTSSGSVDTRIWHFGDGDTSNERNPIHEYDYEGVFTVTLTVIGPGGSDSAMKIDYISVSSSPPDSTTEPVEPVDGDDTSATTDDYLINIQRFPDPVVTEVEAPLYGGTGSLDDEVDTPGITEVGDFHHIDMEGLLTIGRPGEPKLPMRGVSIIIPAGKRIRDCQLILGQKISMTGKYKVEPAPMPVPYSFEGTIEDIPPDEEIYSSDNLYPRHKAYKVNTQQMCGYKIATFKICPMEYKPYSRELSYYKSVALKVNFEDGTGGLESGYRNLPADMSRVAGLVSNPQDIASYGVLADALGYEGRGGMGQPWHHVEGAINLVEPGEYQYVIITNEELSTANEYDNDPTTFSFSDLCEEKNQRGITTNIVTREWICSTYNGNNCAEQIRNFIRDAYNNWETEYILLGGDGGDGGGGCGGGPDEPCSEDPASIIPAVTLFDDPSGDNPALGNYQANIPSDIYYCCLDGSMNSDSDDIFGEIDDGGDIPGGSGDIDLLAEVYIGRAPVATPTEVSNFIRKTLMYRQGPWYVANTYMVGEHLGFGGDAEYANISMEEIRLGSDAHGYSTRGFAILSHLELNTLYDADHCGPQGGCGGWEKRELMDIMDNGVHIINHLGHANVNYVMKMVNDDVDSLVNYNDHFFAYSQGCLPGAFEGDCIAEHLVNNPTGAFAVVMNSRYGWGMGNSTAGPSQYFAREFWDAVFGEFKYRLGVANQDSKEDNLWNVYFECHRWCYLELNLFGDPELVFKFDTKDGSVRLDRRLYQPNADAQIFLMDSDLEDDAIVPIYVTSRLEPTPEIVNLPRNDSGLGIFEGAIQIREAPDGVPITGDGIIQVSVDDIVTVTYAEDDPLELNTDSARIDGVPPVIVEPPKQDPERVYIRFGGGLVVPVSWKTDEEACAVVYYGTNPDETFRHAIRGSCSGVEQTVILEGLELDHRWYYYIESRDVAGNVAIDDNNGEFYSFIYYGPSLSVSPMSLSFEVFEGQTQSPPPQTITIIDSSDHPDALSLDYMISQVSYPWGRGEGRTDNMGIVSISTSETYGGAGREEGTEVEISADGPFPTIPEGHVGDYVVSETLQIDSTGGSGSVDITVTIKPGAAIGFTGYEMIDVWMPDNQASNVNGDDIFNPGEQIDLEVELTSSGSGPALGVSGTISVISERFYVHEVHDPEDCPEEDPDDCTHDYWYRVNATPGTFVSVSGSASWGDMAPGESGVGNFSISASGDAPTTVEATLEVSITASNAPGGKGWTNTYSISIGESAWANGTVVPDANIVGDLDAAGWRGNMNVAVDSTGRIFMVWCDDRAHPEREELGYLSDESDEYQCVYYNYSDDGGVTWLDKDIFLGEGKKPQIVIEGDNIYVIWEDDYDLEVENFDQNGPGKIKGACISGENAGAPPIELGDGMEFMVNNDGDIIVVTWKGGSGSDIICTKTSTDGGKTWGPVTQVNGAGWGQNIAASDNLLVTTWSENEWNEKGEHVNHVYVSYSLDGGVTWQGPVQVDLITPADSNSFTSYSPQILIDEEGNVYITWITEEFDGLDSDGFKNTKDRSIYIAPIQVGNGAAALGTATQLSSPNVTSWRGDSAKHVQMNTDANGRIHMTWVNVGLLYYSYSDDGGVTWNTRQVNPIHNDTQWSTYNVMNTGSPEMLNNEYGTFIIWREDNDTNDGGVHVYFSYCLYDVYGTTGFADDGWVTQEIDIDNTNYHIDMFYKDGKCYIVYTQMVLAGLNCGQLIIGMDNIMLLTVIDVSPPPIISGGGPFTVAEGESVSFEVKAESFTGEQLEMFIDGKRVGSEENELPKICILGGALEASFDPATKETIGKFSWDTYRFYAGTYPVSIVAKDKYGQSACASATITVTPDPNASINPAWNPQAIFSATPLEGIAPLDVTFTNASIGTIKSYAWYFGNGGSREKDPGVVTYTTPGTYSVDLLVVAAPEMTEVLKDVLDLPQNVLHDVESKRGYIKVYPAPVANFAISPTSAEVGVPVNFTSTSTGTFTKWEWNFGGDDIEEGQNVTRTFDIAGTYPFILTVTGPGLNNSATKSGSVTVTEAIPLVADFAATPAEPRAGDPVSFISTSTGTIVDWFWGFGDYETGYGEATSHTYVESGTYGVTLIVTGPGTDNVTAAYQSVTILPAIELVNASFVITPMEAIAGLPVSFDATSSTGTVETWAWEFGDDGTGGGETTSHTYAEAGAYTVTLTVTGPGARNRNIASASVTVTEIVPPVASFTTTPSNEEWKAPLSVGLRSTSTGTIENLRWEDTDGNTGYGDTAMFTYEETGTYTITLTATGPSGLTDTASETITVNRDYTLPVAYFESSPPLGGPAPLTVSVTAYAGRSTITSYEWDFGDPRSGSNIATGRTASHTYINPGTYTISLRVEGPGGSDETSNTIYVSEPLPAQVVAGFSASEAEGIGRLESVSFTNLSTGPIDSYSWDFGNGNTSTEASPPAQDYGPGGHAVSLIVTGPNNTATAYEYINVKHAAPIVSITATPENGVAPLDVTVAVDHLENEVVDYIWICNDGSSERGSDSLDCTFDQPGTYEVTLLAMGPDFNSTASTTVTVTAPIPTESSFSIEVEDGADWLPPLEVVFIGPTDSTIRGWYWDFGDGSTSRISSTSHTYWAPGTYTVTLEVTSAGGSDTASQTITVLTPPLPVASFNASARKGAPWTYDFSYDSSDVLVVVEWDIGGDGVYDIYGTSLTYTFPGPGSYTIGMRATNAGGSAESSQTIVIENTNPEESTEPPVAAFSADPVEGSAPLSVSFSDESTGNVKSWFWDFGEPGRVPEISYDQNPSHTYEIAGTYTVTMDLTGPYGTSSASTTITVDEPLKAVITGGPTEAYDFLSVSFSAEESTGDIQSYLWFLDGGRSYSGSSFSHIFYDPGSHSLTLEVTGPDGSDSASVGIEVYESGYGESGYGESGYGESGYGNDDPLYVQADIDVSPEEGYAPLSVTFSDASVSGSEIVSRVWSGRVIGTSTGSSVTLSDLGPGSYSVRLIVTNVHGISSSASASVTVLDPENRYR